MQVAVPDDGVGTRRVRIEVRPLRPRLGSRAGIHHRVAGAEPVAVLDDVVVRGEGEVAVVGAPEELHAVEQDPVDLLVVERVLLRTAHEEIASDEAIGAVHSHHDVLGVAAGLRRRASRFIAVPASMITSSGFGPVPSICRLQRRQPASSCAGIPRRSERGGTERVARRPRGPARRSGSGRWGR